MSLFALLYPSKKLSDMYLPIESLNNHESLEVIEKSVRLKLKEKLAIIEEKYGDSGNNKEDARWYYLAPMLMDGVIYAKHWIEDIVWEMNTDEEDTTSEVRSSSKDKRNKGCLGRRHLQGCQRDDQPDDRDQGKNEFNPHSDNSFYKYFSQGLLCMKALKKSCEFCFKTLIY